MTMQGGGRSGVRLPTGSRGFSLHQNVQTGSRAHEAFHLKGIERLFSRRGIGRGVKVTTHLHLCVQVKNEWSYTSTAGILSCHGLGKLLSFNGKY
jgi:hypothetical protein